ncbi:MAG: TIGR00730 family Rossman fold protein [Alphaproteobacteria bacterium]|nr:TIGR00730 family Rossman fold protein [Alphaproteobacteria bacterium]
MKTVCVYCSSSNKVKQEFKDATEELGTILANAGKTVVYGGAKSGLMGLIADSTLASGGKVIGVITSYLQNLEVEHDGLTEAHIVETMHERKAMMVDKSDAFIILPGGIGTLEELVEVATWRQLGLHEKPIIIVNTDNYWDSFLDMMNKMVDENCMLSAHKTIFQVVDSPVDVLSALKSFQADSFDVKSKWDD